MSFLLNALLVVLSVALTIAVVFLVSLYIRGAFRWRPLLHIERAIAPEDPHFVLTLKTLAGSLSTAGQVVDFWDSPPDIQQARIKAIESAQHSIQFETFIMTPGKRAQDFAAALARKAAEGVNVQMLVDSWGTRSLSETYWQRLRLAGVRVVFFNPFDWRAPANYAGRTHRKMLIIDGQRVLIGGAGISDLWDGTEKSDDTQPWMDVEAALEGEVVPAFASIFQAHWQGHRLGDRSITGIDMGEIYPALADRDRLGEAKNITYKAPGVDKQIFADRQTDDDLPAAFEPAKSSEKASEKSSSRPTSTMIVTSGTKPSYRNSPIETTKQLLIACARKRVWLASPYFLPNRDTRHLLIEAKRAGVDVRILTTGEKSDKKPVYYASYQVYGSLLREGVQMFEYQPSMIHAKLLIVDDAWVNTGSANLDYRSFLHNDELDIVTDSKRLFGDIERVFDRGFANSEQIGLKQWERRSFWKYRVVGNVVRLVQWQL